MTTDTLIAFLTSRMETASSGLRSAQLARAIESAVRSHGGRLLEKG